MKKIVNSFIVLFSMLFCISCSNDEIEQSSTITFNVNPNHVLDNVYEYKPGDLSSFHRNYELLVSLFIYNDKGFLVNNSTTSFSDYTHIMKEKLSLKTGDYYVIATTMIHDKVNDINFWELSGENQLSTFTLTEGPYIGGNAKILGLTTEKVSVNPDTKSFDINVNLAGSVSVVLWRNWNDSPIGKFDVFKLLSNTSGSNVHLDNEAKRFYDLDTKPDYAYIFAEFHHDPEYSGAVAYLFTLPMKDVRMRFTGEQKDEGWYISDVINANFEIGQSYLISCDVETGKYEFLNKTGTRSIDINRSNVKKDIFTPMYDSNKRKISFEYK